MISRPIALTAALVFAAGVAQAQPPPILALPPAPAKPATGTVLPAGTPVTVRLEADIDSQSLRRGDRVPIGLAYPVMVGDSVAIPAGTRGYAEVLEVDRAIKGQVGEIYLAGRMLMFEDRPIRLTGVRFWGRGASDQKLGFFTLTLTGEPAVMSRAIESAGQLAEDTPMSRDFSVQLPRPPAPERLTGPLPAGLAHPPPGKAQVIFFRPLFPQQPRGNNRLFEGPDDKGTWLATLPPGSWLAFYFDAGPKIVTSQGEFDDTLHLDLEAGETYYVQLNVFGGNPGYAGGWTDLFVTGPAEFLAIKPKVMAPKELKRRAVKP